MDVRKNLEYLENTEITVIKITVTFIILHDLRRLGIAPRGLDYADHRRITAKRH
jgi:hypothetical protein